jgi:hypothetical protein
VVKNYSSVLRASIVNPGIKSNHHRRFGSLLQFNYLVKTFPAKGVSTLFSGLDLEKGFPGDVI